MAAKPAPKKKKPAKKAPQKVLRSVRAKSRTKAKPAARKVVRAAPPKKPAPKPAPKPSPRIAAIAWFEGLARRIQAAEVTAIQALIAEARRYDLVGLEQALGNHEQVLALNGAANQLIEAGLQTFGAASPVGFQLQVLRDILNDS